MGSDASGGAVTGVWVLHNPECSKSRETLKLISGMDMVEPAPEVTVLEYLDMEPAEQLAPLLRLLIPPLVANGGNPQDMVRSDEAAQDTLRSELAGGATPAEAVVATLVKHPHATQRPVVAVVRGEYELGHVESAVIARPPSKAVDLIQAAMDGAAA